MRRLLAAVAALFLGSAALGAQEADWSGFYVGGGGGAAALGYETMFDYTWPGFLFVPPVAVSQSLGTMRGAGGSAVLQIGYTTRLGDRLVAGVQLDGQFGTIEAASAAALALGPVSPGYAYALRARSVTTLGGRLGWLIDDRTLVYGLLGHAWGRFEGQLDLTLAGTPFLSQTNGFSLGGTALGLGVERQIGPHTALVVELRTTRFARRDMLDSPMLLPGDRLRMGYNPAIDSVRVLLNFRF